MHIITNGGVCTPLGFTASTVAANVKGKNTGKQDMALLVSDVPMNVAALFTTNRVKAAPVLHGKDLVAQKKPFTGILVNSGNANACTGPEGYEDCVSLCKAVEAYLDAPEGSILSSSTGVIGARMPIERMKAKIGELADGLNDDFSHEFATAIMTTDTVPKEIAVLVESPKGAYIIGGAAKGAGMIDPTMATMLAFITTDAGMHHAQLDAVLKGATEKSFNSITVDGDMSTNDTIFLMANGFSGISLTSPEEVAQFQEALTYVCLELAKMIVRDGEGATKLVTIAVEGAVDDAQAKMCANKIANSPLIKTMFAGCDPNWGRLMMAAGCSGAEFDPENVTIYFDELKYAEKGKMVDPALEDQAYAVMQKPAFTITLNLNTGSGTATVYTCDLTKEYVAINADYRS